ncbi:MAG: endonuclease MutS2 [Clostridia bacterium]|nr:endonuclease MutS2 [Clostridia bacterium]
MDRHTLEKLELDKVLVRLQACCYTELGKKLAAGIKPFTDIETVRTKLEETSEAARLVRLHPVLPFHGITDIHPLLERVKLGSTLKGEELVLVRQVVQAARHLKEFFAGLKESYPRLEKLAARIETFQALEVEIARALDPDGRVKDEASPELARWRRRIGVLEQRIHDCLEGLIHSREMQPYLQDPIVTSRAGRYVVPVKSEYRSQVPGLVHDQSASGATVFIEPMAVVELNNELRAAQAAERHEVEAILGQLSRQVGKASEAIGFTLGLLGQLDLILARGHLSQRMNAVAPELNTEGRLKLDQARHPLLSGKVVPISVEVGRDFTCLIITGPNTGGKTVALKTVGLLCLMAQCGLHIPAEDTSQVPIWQQILVDIGDEQSIEQSLSTFSSHMKNIIYILEQSDENTLVLLDELGAGTDPAEGAALGAAILDELRSRQTRVIATTHYGDLKIYAYQTPGVENAAVEFDVASLEPTYQLRIGAPGSSNALEIAQRLGLSSRVLQQARQYLGPGQVAVSDLVQDLETKRLQAERELNEARSLRRQAEQRLAQVQAQEQEIKERREQILRRAREEWQETIRQARERVNAMLGEFRQLLDLEAARAKDRGLAALQAKLKAVEEEVEDKIAGDQEEVLGQPLAEVRVGSQVYLPRLGLKGVVVDINGDRGQAIVQAGAMRVAASMEDLYPAAGEPGVESGIRPKPAPAIGGEGKTEGLGAIAKGKAASIGSQIDLRGKRVEEALAEVDKYLDDAILAGLGRVVLIHGKGTGALRQAVSEYLGQHPRVKAYRLGAPNEGGLGVTVVEL